ARRSLAPATPRRWSRRWSASRRRCRPAAPPLSTRAIPNGRRGSTEPFVLSGVDLEPKSASSCGRRTSVKVYHELTMHGRSSQELIMTRLMFGRRGAMPLFPLVSMVLALVVVFAAAALPARAQSEQAAPADVITPVEEYARQVEQLKKSYPDLAKRIE